MAVREGLQVFPARRFSAAATAFLPFAGACLALLFSAVDARAQGAAASCADAAEIAVLPSPIAPWKGAPLRVIVAAEKPLEGELSLIAPDGRVAAKSRERQGGPPYAWFVEVASPAAGTWRATLTRERATAGCSTITRDIAVAEHELPRPRTAPGSVWPLRAAWDRANENLFSAWIEKLFDAPLDAAPLEMLGQPAAPAASEPPKQLGLAAGFGQYLQMVANGVHSASGRTLASDNNTDYYPVSLTQDTLRPGTVYADPYGHILMIVK